MGQHVERSGGGARKDQPVDDQSVQQMLGSLRDSLAEGRSTSDRLAEVLCQIHSNALASTIDMSLQSADESTEVAVSSDLSTTGSRNCAVSELQRLLNNPQALGRLAGIVAQPGQEELRELLHAEVASSNQHGEVVNGQAAVAATQVFTPDPSTRDFSFSQLGFVNSNSFSLNLEVGESVAGIAEQDYSNKIGVEIGSLEKNFELRVDALGKPIAWGKGGMGVVLTGFLRDGGTEFAIKVCSEPKNEPRMVREYEVLKRLAVEGFPLVGGIYRNADGQLCYSMKLVRGDSYLTGYEAFHTIANDPKCSVDQYIRFTRDRLLVERPKDGFGQPEINQIFRGLLERLIDVATGVSTMHEVGVIHRDLKPENVKIEDKTRRAVILDLGLAKIQDQPDLAADTRDFLVPSVAMTKLTMVGVAAGTIAYMPPEQASGDSTTHTKAIDIYALGAMLYYLMTGKHAISLSGPPLKVLERLKKGEFDPPVRLPVIRADFPDLEAICTKAMATDPQQRYAKVDDLIIDLRAWLAGSRVKAYEEQLSSDAQKWERWRYSFHHWKKQNTGPWNRYVTGALAVFTAGGGLLAYFGNESAKADRAAVSAERSLSGITEEVDRRVREFFGTDTIQTLSVAKLDELASGGKLELFLDEQRKRLAKEILQATDGGVANYAQYSVARNIMSQAMKADEELEYIGAIFKQRVANRAQMRQELETFRKEFAPIKDFMGIDFDSFMTDVSHKRLDQALARYLPTFKYPSSVQAPSGPPQLFFPECTKDLEHFVEWCEKQEFTSSERQELKDSIATLLSYKVLNLQRNPATGFAPHVQPVLPMCSEYLEESRRLKGREPSVFDLILWQRVASALGDPRGAELLNRVKEVAKRALIDESYARQLGRQDLGILAKHLVEGYRYEDARKLFDTMLAQAAAADNNQEGALPSRYLGEFGSAYCAYFLALEASKTAEPDASKIHQYLDEASGGFQRSLAHLSGLSEASPDRKTKEEAAALGLAKIAIQRRNAPPDPEPLRTMELAHRQVRKLGSGPRSHSNIGVNLMNVGNWEEAAAEFSLAIETAPYAANKWLPARATCYATLGLGDEMLRDVETVLKNATSEETASMVEPRDLSQSALAVAAFLWGKEGKLPIEAQERYLGLMKQLLTEVKKRCSSGAPYTLEQLNVQTELFDVLKNHDPAFWDDYVQSVSSAAGKGSNLR